MSKKVSPGEIGRKVEIPSDGQPVRVIGSVGILDQPILISGQTAAGSYFPLKVVKDGSVGQLDIHGVIGTVYVGTVAIGAIAGSVHIQGTIDTINYIGSIGHVNSGSIGVLNFPTTQEVSGSVGIKELPSITGTVDIRTGSVGISGQPIDVHGSVGIKGTVHVDTELTGTIDVGNFPTTQAVTGSVDVRTGTIKVSNIATDYFKGTSRGSVAISGQPIAVTGTVDNVRTASGTCGLVSIVGSPKLLLDGNSSRLGAFVQNIGSTAGTGTVYIGFDHTVAATKCGAILKDSDSYSTTIYTGSIWGKGTGSIDIAVHEY